VQELDAETARSNWRPICSYTANLHRLGDALLDTDAAWVQIGRAVAVPQTMIGPMFGGPPGGPGAINERTLADRMVPQYPWTWSAGVLAGLLGLSLWILSMRIKSLDRLR
jgi:ABC-2 type transport system permease protein